MMGRKRVRGVLLLLAGALTLSGCAYFNTFYLARMHFDEAEYQRYRAEQQEQPLPSTAMDSYRKSLHFASRILSDYPESRWVEEALLLSQKVLYHQGQVAASVRKAEELRQAFPQSRFLPESRLYLAQGLLALGAEADAASEAAQAAGMLTGPLRAEAQLVEARALLRLGRPEEAGELFSRLARDPESPQEVMLEARLENARILERQGRFMEAYESLDTLLEDPSLRRSLRIETTIRRIDLLLQAGDSAAVGVEVARLSDLDITGFHRGVGRYYRGLQMAGREGGARQASSELVLALRDGVTPDWEARIRLDLAKLFEVQGSYHLAWAEYRAVTAGQGTPAQQEHARHRMDAILNLFSLRSLASRHEPITPFPDPRGGQGATARMTPGQQVRRPPPGQAIDPDTVLAREGVGQQGPEPARPPLPEMPVPDGIYLFLLAEQWFYQMARPDSARHYLDLTVHLHPDSPVAPQALFALTEWYDDTPRWRQAGEEAVGRLLQDYPESTWAWRYRTARGEQGVPLPIEIEAERALHQVEANVEPLADPSTWGAAVAQYRDIVKRYPDTPAAPLAALAAARLIEAGAGPSDSARVAYEQVVARYPDRVEGWMAAVKLVDGILPTTRPDPNQARLAAVEQESATWTAWLQRQQPAQVNRLQPGAQRLGGSVPPRGTGPPASVPPPRPPTGGGVIPPTLRRDTGPAGNRAGGCDQ